MTALAFAVAGSGLLNPMPSSYGVSQDAETLRGCVETTRGHLSQSLSIRTFFDASVTRLNQATAVARVHNWDGYGAKPVDAASYHRAIGVLRSLPTTTPLPDISIEPDGEVEFCWTRGARRILSVSIGPSGRMSYAALFGASRSYGSEFMGSEIPRPILENLKRVFTTT